MLGEAVWPAIVDPGDWARLRARLDSSPQPRGPGRRYLLTGIASCGLCGALLVARPKADGRRCLVCASGVNFGGCGKIRQLAEPLDRMVVLAVMGRLADRGVGEVVEDQPASSWVAELDRIATQRLRLANQWHNELIDDASWQEALRLLNESEERARASMPPPDLAVQWAGDPDELMADWDGLHIDQQRALVASVVERVVVAPAVKGRNFFDPDRVSIVWRA